MDPKLKEVFETEYAKIPEFVQSFLEKNSLKDKLEKYSTLIMDILLLE